MYFNKVSIYLSNIREYNMSDLIHKRIREKNTIHGVFQTNNESFGSELWNESFRMSSCAFYNYVVPLPAETSGCTVRGKYLKLKTFLVNSCRSYYIAMYLCYSHSDLFLLTLQSETSPSQTARLACLNTKRVSTFT